MDRENLGRIKEILEDMGVETMPDPSELDEDPDYIRLYAQLHELHETLSDRENLGRIKEILEDMGVETMPDPSELDEDPDYIRLYAQLHELHETLSELGY